jgi:hypothetical protein
MPATFERYAAHDRVGGRGTLFVYFGHHKCASTWLNDIVREVCAAAGHPYANVHNPSMFGSDLNAFVSRKGLEFLAYANANYSFVSALDDFRGFHVIRDPRDIVVSSYFSHLHSHPTTDWPELVDHRRQLQEMGKEQGLYVVMDFLTGVLDDIATWDYSDPRVLELKMEDVVARPEELLLQAFTFVGVADEANAGLSGSVVAALSSLKRRRSALVPFRLSPLPSAVVVKTVRRNAFEKKAGGRTAGIENVDSHYRKGVAGDWINHFDAGHKEYFKSIYGQLLIKLGYEADLSW